MRMKEEDHVACKGEVINEYNTSKI